MTLGDEQIERYSRQIVVPRIGGRAQERLLASRLVLAGALDAVTPSLAYLAGAGVGTIRLAVAGDRARLDALVASMRDLNSDVTVSSALLDAADGGGETDLLFAIVDGEAALRATRGLPDGILCGPSVTARLDLPARIAVLPSPPPCLRCAAGEMLGPMRTRVENPEVPAMAACVEVLKLLAGYEPATAASIIEFDGYTSASLRAAADPGVRCACGGGGAG